MASLVAPKYFQFVSLFSFRAYKLAMVAVSFFHCPRHDALIHFVAWKIYWNYVFIYLCSVSGRNPYSFTSESIIAMIFYVPNFKCPVVIHFSESIGYFWAKHQLSIACRTSMGRLAGDSSWMKFALLSQLQQEIVRSVSSVSLITIKNNDNE